MTQGECTECSEKLGSNSKASRFTFNLKKYQRHPGSLAALCDAKKRGHVSAAGCALPAWLLLPPAPRRRPLPRPLPPAGPAA